MTAEQLLQQLELDQLKIELKDDHLSLTGEKSKITSHILAEIQSNKAALISLLSDCSQSRNGLQSNSRRYRRDDGSHFELDSEEFGAIVEFCEMIHSLIYSDK
ncbi:MAG: hypothetical protein M3Q07_11135 [Pseudobdellovibrionaceae bacterium]|nr:hypothetical protein [Pseudobdellovibrionaceae bacterium]